MGLCSRTRFFIFFFNDTATTEIYTLSLHDALPIYAQQARASHGDQASDQNRGKSIARERHGNRSEEHTSELQSQSNLVCRLLLEKKDIFHVYCHTICFTRPKIGNRAICPVDMSLNI